MKLQEINQTVELKEIGTKGKQKKENMLFTLYRQPKGGMLTLFNIVRITISDGSNIQPQDKQEQLEFNKLLMQ